MASRSLNLVGYEPGVRGRTQAFGFRQKDHPLWGVYRGMIGRCELPSVAGYKYYGGRGVTVCERWRKPGGFINWLADMGPRPTPDHQIDRVDPYGNYEPANCRWATRKQQRANRRDT